MSDINEIDNRSTRHAKITGDFAEHLTLYILSKRNFECACVDHTGMDIIASNPVTGERMGISVKGRSRKTIRAAGALNVRADNFKKLADACAAFGCVPYYSFVIDRQVDGVDRISVYIMSQETLFELYPRGRDELMIPWAMNAAAVSRYCGSPNIYRWELTHKIEAWWP